MCSVKAGKVLHLRSHSTDKDTVLIQFSSPRIDSLFCYSVNVTCAPGGLTLVRFVHETAIILDAYFFSWKTS